MKTISQKSGFTLVELIVTLAVAAIILGWAVPSVSALMKNNRTTTNVSDFLGALNYARSEAITRGSRVTICIANATFTQCDTSGTAKWKNGWLIYDDPTGSTVTIVDPTTDILRIHQGLSGNSTTLDLPSTGIASRKKHLSFTATGTGLDQVKGDGGNWTYVLCDDRLFSNSGQYARKIHVNLQGRARALLASASGGAIVTDCT